MDAAREMRVLDLSQLFPGPYCSRILADFGAEVIKVERPGEGDWLRYVPPLAPEDGESLLFRALNRGKKSLTLDLKSDKGRTILLRLVETADVLLESFRPGVMERLGLGYETLAQVNPRAVGCPPKCRANATGMQASALPKRDPATHCPLPVRSRASSASRMPTAPHSAPARSATVTPGITGGPSLDPVRSKRPARPM